MPVLDKLRDSKWLNRTGLYGFELFMSLIGLLVTAGVINYSFYAIFNHLKGLDSNFLSMGEFSIWLVAAMIVWLPATLFFYVRSRGESAVRSEVAGRSIHKVLIGIFYVINMIAAIAFAFAAVYGLIRYVVGGTDTTFVDVFVRVILPSILAGLVHIGMLGAFSQVKWLGRKQFAVALVVTAAVCSLVLFTLSAIPLRNESMDQTTTSDLVEIEGDIQRHYADEKQLPAQLADIDIDDEALSSRLDNYRYQIDGQDRYTICADFNTDSGDERYAPYSDDEDDYSYSPYFHAHDKGENCFKVKVSSFSFDFQNKSNLDS